MSARKKTTQNPSIDGTLGLDAVTTVVSALSSIKTSMDIAVLGNTVGLAFGGSAFLDVQDHRLPCLSHDRFGLPQGNLPPCYRFPLHQQPPKLGGATVKVAIRQDPNGSRLRTVSNAVSPLPWELRPYIG